VPVTIAVFVSGAVLLGLEIAASRVLAPYFGNSLYVWGALIGVVLAGLAVGYWLGGTLADRWPEPWLLVAAMSLGAAGVVAVPLLDQPVLDAIVAWDPEPRLNAVLAAVCLFGLPSVVLAGVTPIAIRLRADAITRLGRTSGRLFAVSTFGSIVGTFATAFWLVPEMGTDQVIAVGGVVLLAGAAAVAAAERLVLPLVVALAALCGATAVAAGLETQTGGRLPESQTRNYSPTYRLREALRPRLHARHGADVVYSKDTRYHRLIVVQSGGIRTLVFDSLSQSAMRVGSPFATEYEYTDYLQLRPRIRPGRARRPVSRPRRRLRAEALLARPPAAPAAGRRDRPRCHRRRAPLLRRPARPPPADPRGGRPPLPRRG
jgi:MFS family permease